MGQLHVFVSPMQRNLETVDPLMRLLRSKDFGADSLTATVNPDQYEIPAVSFPADRPRFMQGMALQERGEWKLKKVLWRAARQIGPAGQLSRTARQDGPAREFQI